MKLLGTRFPMGALRKTIYLKFSKTIEKPNSINQKDMRDILLTTDTLSVRDVAYCTGTNVINVIDILNKMTEGKNQLVFGLPFPINVDAIEFPRPPKQERINLSNRKTAWVKQDDDLVHLVRSGLGLHEIADELGRTPNAIIHRINTQIKNGVDFNKYSLWERSIIALVSYLSFSK